jgi:hypothetical protein
MKKSKLNKNKQVESSLTAIGIRPKYIENSPEGFQVFDCGPVLDQKIFQIQKEPLNYS